MHTWKQLFKQQRLYMQLPSNKSWDPFPWKVVLRAGSARLWFSASDLEADLPVPKIRATLSEMQKKGFVVKGSKDVYGRLLFKITNTDQLRNCIRSGILPASNPVTTTTHSNSAPHDSTLDPKEYMWKPVLRPGALDAFLIPSRGTNGEYI